MFRNSASGSLIGVCVLVAGSGVCGGGQQKQANPGTATLGDVTVSGTTHISGQMGTALVIVGPRAAVDVTVPGPGKRKVHVESPRMIVKFNAKGNFQVATLEAMGPVKFSGDQVVAEGGSHMQGTGTHALYTAKTGLLKVDGPVSYSANQTTKDHTGDNSVAGTADAATYNAIHQLVVLTGNVDATFKLSGPDAQSVPFQATAVTLDLAQRPIAFTADTSGIGPLRITPKPKKQ